MKGGCIINTLCIYHTRLTMKIYDFTVKNRKGEDISLRNFEGKVLLIVNTAT